MSDRMKVLQLEEAIERNKRQKREDESTKRGIYDPSKTVNEVAPLINDGWEDQFGLKEISKTNEEYAAYLVTWADASQAAMKESSQWVTDDERRELRTKIMALRIASDAIRQVGPFAPIKEDISGLRPCVFVFASAMENKLRKHDQDRGKEGWRDGTFTPVMAYLRMKAEMEELEAALSNNHGDPNMQESRQEAVDVANFAMMLWDLCLTIGEKSNAET